MFVILWDVKVPAHYSQRVGHGVPGVVTVPCDCMFHRMGALNLEPRSVVLPIHQEGASLVDREKSETFCTLRFVVNTEGAQRQQIK